MSGFYSLKAELPNGDVFDFADLKGKTVLIVNIASKWYVALFCMPRPFDSRGNYVTSGFTPQHKGLQALDEKYKDKGLVILGFPCNQFGSQEPGSDEQIKEFCTVNYGVNFQLMKKSNVNGDETNEVYKWLKSEKPGLLGLTRIKWNFEKFLVDKNGKVVNRWASTTTPSSLEPEIEKIL